MPGKFRRTPHPPGVDPARSEGLNAVTEAIDRGFPSTALVLATDMGVQFGSDTLRRWLRGRQGLSSYRRTYAAIYYLRTEGRIPNPRRRRRSKNTC